jgi:hypothetical protein
MMKTMNSSIFNFNARALFKRHLPIGDDATAWRRFVCLNVFCTIGFVLGCYLLLVALDPYDTGRFAVLPSAGISDIAPRTANASRGRDPQFNAAVFGNSRGQLLDPFRLSAMTGQSFVQLTVPGTGPREQLALLRWFMHHHATVEAIVIVADESWCTSDSSLPISYPFPFWLYSDSNIDYLKSLMRTQAFDRLWRRVRLAFGLLGRSDPAGYWNYELDFIARGYAPRLQDSAPITTNAVAAEMPLPAIERLGEAIADLAPTVPIVIVTPPVFSSALPAQASAARIAHCKMALATLLAERPRSGLLDFLDDGPIARDPNNFWDHTHYRANVARLIEDSIVRKLTGG